MGYIELMTGWCAGGWRAEYWCYDGGHGFARDSIPPVAAPATQGRTKDEGAPNGPPRAELEFGPGLQEYEAVQKTQAGAGGEKRFGDFKGAFFLSRRGVGVPLETLKILFFSLPL